MENIKDIIKIPERKKPPAYKWQELALQIVAGLADGESKKKSIFNAANKMPTWQKSLLKITKNWASPISNIFSMSSMIWWKNQNPNTWNLNHEPWSINIMFKLLN